MAGVVRLAAITQGSIDSAHGRASFAFKFANGQTLTCVAQLDQIEDIAAALGRIAQEVRRESPQEAVAKEVLAYGVTSDRAAARVLMKLVTPGGISHVFAIAKDWAQGLAAQLQAETPALRDPGASADV
jgi:hypothetical protein